MLFTSKYLYALNIKNIYNSNDKTKIQRKVKYKQQTLHFWEFIKNEFKIKF